MKRKTKRRIGIFLVVAMLAILVFPAFSAMAEGDEDFVIDNGVLLEYIGVGGSVTIPDTVTSIGDGAFQNDTTVTSVVVPATVNTIGSYAFAGCTFLDNIVVPSSVTNMGSAVFSGCSSLSGINFAPSIGSLPAKTFFDCVSLSSVTIPEGVTSIGDGAFEECSLLSSINIPGAVSGISNSAFDGCGNLTSITVSENNAMYSSYDGCVYNKTKTKLLYCPAGKSSIDTYANTLTYATGSFSGCNAISELNIPSGVTTIESNAFSDSGIQTLTIPASITSIGSQASWDPAIIYTYSNTAGESFAAAYNYNYELLDAVDVEGLDDDDDNGSEADGDEVNEPVTDTQVDAATATPQESTTTTSGTVADNSSSAAGTTAGNAHVLDETPTTGPELNAKVILCIAVFFVGIYLIITSRKEEQTA